VEVAVELELEEPTNHLAAADRSTATLEEVEAGSSSREAASMPVRNHSVLERA